MSTIRIRLYRWLSTLFSKEIDRKTLELYRQGPGEQFLKELSTFPALEPEVRALQRLLGEINDTNDYALELAGAYGFLFLGAGGPQSVPPYESVYTSESGSMFQEAERQTREILEEHGLSISKDVREPADHIAIQLELMARFAEIFAETESTDAERAGVLIMQQKTFLEDHLLNWVPAFSAYCVEHDPNGFYGALAQLAVTVLEEDHAYLKRSVSKTR